MARRGKPQQVNWYLREWVDYAFENKRGRQARMAELAGWSKATMSQLYNNEQDYSPKVVNEAAAALKAKPWELLMPPEQAMRLRRIQIDAAEIAKVAAVDALEPMSDVVVRRSRTAEEEGKRAAGSR